MNLEKLKVRMVLQYPFFGALLHKLEHIETERVPTAATDGYTVLYNPKFMDTLSFDEQLFIVAHELLHAAFLHVPRFKSMQLNSSDMIAWNIATDLLINDLLVNEQAMSMPKVGLLDKKYKFKDWTSEALFKEISKNITTYTISGKIGNGAGACAGNDMQIPKDENGLPKDISEAQAAKEAQEWQIAVNEAAIVAKQAGDCPASIERLIQELLKPKINWKEALLNWFNEKVKNLNDWHNPNRRFVSQEIYFPSKKTDNIGHLIVSIDTSGSIGEYELAVFGSELNYIFEQVRPSKVTVIHCDCDINKTEEFTEDDFPLKLKPYGGGGTSFIPPFDWVKRNLENDPPSGMVYMTDMCGDFPKKAPNYPVLWLATSDIKAPFGETIRYDLEKI